MQAASRIDAAASRQPRAAAAAHARGGGLERRRRPATHVAAALGSGSNAGDSSSSNGGASSSGARRAPRPPAAAPDAAPDTLLAPPPAAVACASQTPSSSSVEYLGVVGGMLTVRGVLDLPGVPPAAAYAALTDYEACARVFGNIAATATRRGVGDTGLQLVQACRWQFLGLSGTFNVTLSVAEDTAARLLVFRLVESTFMRDFEGRWQVGSTPCGGGARVEHVLAVKPLMPVPPPIAAATRGIFTRQVEAILGDLAAELKGA